MKNSKLLLVLADYLSKLDRDKYNMMDHMLGPLGHAARLPEFKAAGWVMAVNDNDKPVGVKQAKYKGTFDCEAASVFFDITNIESQYLFGETEMDLWGYAQKPMHGSERRDIRNARDQEPPALTAARIRAFVADPTRDCLDRRQAERV